jgi:hypothetical protein
MLFVKRFLSYIKGWFLGAKEDAVQTVIDEPAPPPPKRTYKKRTPFFTLGEGERQIKKSFPQSFSELLDNLGMMFQKLKLPTEFSDLHADERVGLTRLGIYLPHPWLADNPAVVTQPRVKELTKLPAIVCVAFPYDIGGDLQRTNEDGNDRCSPHLLYAIKVKNIPLGVQAVSGVPYKVGMAFDIKGKLTWYSLWASINPLTGDITFCRELRYRACKFKGGGGYMQRVNKLPGIFDPDEEARINAEERYHVYSVLFAQVFNWWIERKDKSWSVAVNKNKQRITFSINRDETKKYFADRDKTVLTATGRAKKIVHYVADHTRVIKGKSVFIKEHLRGERKFTWNEYDCTVTAPKFNELASVTFDIASSDEEELSPDMKRQFIGLSKVAKLLAAYEDRA